MSIDCLDCLDLALTVSIPFSKPRLPPRSHGTTIEDVYCEESGTFVLMPRPSSGLDSLDCPESGLDFLDCPKSGLDCLN